MSQPAVARVFEEPVGIVMRGESLNWIVRQHPTLFHAQDWFRAEEFAGLPYFGSFRVRPEVAPAAAYALAFVQEYVKRGRILWTDRYVLTSDVDHEGHRVYVGRAAQYGGLQVHRHLPEAPV